MLLLHRHDKAGLLFLSNWQQGSPGVSFKLGLLPFFPVCLHRGSWLLSGVLVVFLFRNKGKGWPGVAQGLLAWGSLVAVDCLLKMPIATPPPPQHASLTVSFLRCFNISRQKHIEPYCNPSHASHPIVSLPPLSHWQQESQQTARNISHHSIQVNCREILKI